MPQTFINPVSGQEEETCSVSFASQMHVASVHDGQTEAQLHKSKLLGEWGVIKGKLATGQIPDRTKVLTYEGTNAKGYIYVKDGKFYVRRYSNTGKMNEMVFDENTQNTYFKVATFKWAIPQATKLNQPSDLMESIVGVGPDQPMPMSAWGKLKKAGNDGKIPDGTVVLVNENGMDRLVYKDGKWKAQTDWNEDGNWQLFESFEHPADVLDNMNEEGWKTPPATPIPGPAASQEPKPMTQAEAKLIQQSDSLKEGDILAVAKSSSGATQYRIVMGKEDSPAPFLVMAKGPSDTAYSQIDKSDWFPDLIDDGNKWYKPEDKPEPVAAPTPKPPVAQNSASAGSMSDEDVAIMFVKIKDQLAAEKGINIKGSNPELDLEVYKAIGDQIGYQAYEVKAKIDAYKATGKKLSALKKKHVKKGDQPTAPATVTNPDPDPEPNGVPTQATESVIEDASAAAQEAVETNPNVVHSNEDIAAAYIMAKDKIVAESNGKWTLYTKNPEMDAAIYKAIQDKTGVDEAKAKHAIALYLSDPGNKLSKLKKSLIKQGKMKAEADTLKKKSTPAQMQAELNHNADTGYTPDGASNPEAPIANGPFVPRNKPKVEDLGFTGTTLGTHHAQVWADKDGNQWLFKPQDQFLTEIDVATSKLAKKLGHPAADTYEVTLNGKTGSLQRMFPGGDAFPTGLNPETTPTAHILAVQKEHVLDWLMANHDNHDKNYVLDEQGNIVGIDKGQALKFFGMDRLAWDFFPNQFEPAPNKLFKAFADGKNVALNDPSQGELKAFIEHVMAMPDQELKDLFRPYAEAAKAKGYLLNPPPYWKSHTLGPKTLPVNNVDAFLDALVKRKNSLDKDFAALYKKAKDERDKKIPPTVQVEHAVTDEPGDISHIPENVKETYKNHVGSLYAADTPEVIYTKLTNGIQHFKGGIFTGLPQEHLGKMSVLQAVRVMDELKAKKANVPNGHLYEKKLVDWLISPAGKEFFQKQKDKEEALAKMEQMKANQPDLPADSALFTNIEEDEVRKWQSEQTPWTEGQKESLRHYTSNQGYTEMNGNLRGSGYKNDRVDKHVSNARAGMRPIHRAITTHRGTTAISFGLADNGSENDLLYGLVGTLHKQIGFSSASFGSRAGFGTKPVIIHFECPPGMPAAYVKDISHYRHENEILLDHALEVRVLKVWETGSGWSKQYHVQVRVENWEGKQ